jgi:protein involved in polysaccharide export with SLBB domain
MKRLVVCAALVCGSLSSVIAQDPGFQPAQAARQPATQPAPSSGGDDVRSAGLINSMELLDNSIPLQPDYQISFRIVEDRSEPIRLRVQDSGEIQAPHIGLVRAAGRTCRDLALNIKRELEKSYYNRATVIIAIDVIPKVASGGSSMGPGGVMRGQEYFTVFGQVLRQGKYELPFDEDVSISQAILRAGGPAQFANLGKVRLIRKTPQGNKTVLVDVEQIMTRGTLENDIVIRSNDVLIVPEKIASF